MITMVVLTNVVLGVTGLFLVSAAMIMKTKDTISSLYFKVIPLQLGLLCLFCLAWRIML